LLIFRIGDVQQTKLTTIRFLAYVLQ